MRVAVLGGGISGCVLSAELARGGCDVTLIEGSPRLGGLHKTVSVDDYKFDIGAFVFGDKHSVFKTFPDLIDIFPKVTSKFGSVRSTGFIDSYPMSLRGLREQYGSAFLIRVLGETLMAKVRFRKRGTAADWVKYYIGPSLYERSGLRRYIKRLYLAPDTEIDVTFAEKRMGRMSASASLRSVLGRVASRVTRGRGLVPIVGPKISPWVRVRAVGGFDEVYGFIERALGDLGVTVMKSQMIKGISRDGPKYVMGGLDDVAPFDAVFSTIPVEISARLIGINDIPRPETVDVFSLFYDTAADLPFDNTVLHNYTEGGQWKRLTMLSLYYGKQNDRHYFVVEGTSLPDEDADDVLAAARADFDAWAEREGIFGTAPNFLDGVVTKNGYPVYRTERMTAIGALKEQVAASGVRLVGRQGSFDYISSSDAAKNARDAAHEFVRTEVDSGRQQNAA